MVSLDNIDMSKSLFGGTSTSSSGRSMFSVAPRARIVYVNVQVIDPDYDLSANTLATLQRIEDDYLLKLVRREFDGIASNMNDALVLYDEIYQLQMTRKSEIVKLMLQLTMDGLQGAMNVYVLYTRNIELQLTNTILENKIETILSGKNDKTAMTNASGQIGITKTFTLAPLYSYYIMLYGLPVFGVGFDLIKLELVRQVLLENGIDPQG